MKKIILVTFIILHPSVLLSQWSQISTINTSQLNAVKFFTEFTGITAGQGGIWRSTNSGVNWTQVLTGANLNSVSFPDNNTGYAVGDSGKIFKTINNGLNWQQLNSVTVNNLYGTSFITPLTGYLVGQNGIILRTQSGGSSWTNQFNPISEDLNAIVMLSSAIAHGVGSYYFERFITTGNGGINWTYTINNGGNSLKSLSTIGNSKIEVVGTGGIIRFSTNGGTWTLIPSGTNNVLNSLIFIDTLMGYIAGNNGIILRSTNGGLNWTQQTSGTTYNLKAISFINSIVGWMVGQNGIILRTGIPVNITKTANEISTKFKLYQNYPNPFNPRTIIKFDIPENEYVTIAVYNISGECVENIFSGYLKTGSYIINYNGNSLASGVYFYSAKLNNYNYSKKMILIK